MTITMPEGLQELSDVVVGTSFPEGDEDALRRLAAAWATCAGEVGSVLGDTEAAVKDALSTMEGETAEAFKKYGESLTQGDEAPLVKLQNLCEQLGEACDNVALEVEYTKISIITALSLLFAQIAAALALAVVTFGASTAAIPAMQAGVRAVVQGLVQTLVREIVKQVGINLGANLFIDGAIQAGQFLAGDREEWDTSKTGAAALSGVAGGIGGGIASGVFGGIAKGIGGKFADNVETPPGGKKDPVGWGGSLTYEATSGTAGATMGGAINNDLQGEQHNEQNMGSAALGGTVGGGLSGLGRGYDSGLEQGTLPHFGPSSGQTLGSDAPGSQSNTGDSTPDPDSAPDPESTPGSGGQSDPDAGQGDQSDGGADPNKWMEWDGAPPLDPESTPGSGGQSGPDEGQGDQSESTPGQNGQSDPNTGQNNQSGWKEFVEPATKLPPHMVNAPSDMYTDELNLPEPPTSGA